MDHRVPVDPATEAYILEAGVGLQGSGARAGSWSERLYAVVEILLCAGIATTLLAQLAFTFAGFDFQAILASPKLTVAFLLLESLLLLSLMTVLQGHRGESLGDLGVFAGRLGLEARIGLAIVPVLFMANFLVAQLFQLFLPQWLSEDNPLLGLIKTPTDLLLFLLVSVLAGGIKEEIQRAFILQRFRKYLSAATAGVVIWSLAFGAGHALQGVDSACGAAVYGLIFGLVYFWRNSLVAPMVAHTLYDVSVLLVYWFFGR